MNPITGFFLLFFAAGGGFAQDNAAAPDTSSVRSAIVEVDWFEYLSDDKTLGEIRRSALNNAKRDALEKASTYIQSVTKIENFMLQYDLIQSGAQGYVRVLDSKDYGITADNRYRYWLKAEVQYVIKPPASGAEAAADLSSVAGAPLTVHVWTNQTAYRNNDQIQIFIRGNKDFYGRVVYQDASGNLMQLLPNPLRTGTFFKGGEVTEIPGPGDRFKLQVGPPFGAEQIIVFASTSPMGRVEVENVNNSLYTVRGGLDQVSRQTRGVQFMTTEETSGVVTSEPNTQNVQTGANGAEFYEAKCALTTQMSP